MPSRGLKFVMAIEGKLREYDHAVAVAATLAVRTVTSRMKSQGRQQMRRAGLGHKLPNAFRGTVYSERGEDITRHGIDANPRGVVASSAFVKRPSGVVDLIEVFETGTVVLPIHGSFLAMPTKEAGGLHARPMSAYPGNTFRLLPYKKTGRARGKNPPTFLAIHKARKEVWYLLFPSVTLKKRLNLDVIYIKQAADVVRLHAEYWEREAAKLETKL